MSEPSAPEEHIPDPEPMPACAMCGEPFYAGPDDVACIDCDPDNKTRKAAR